MGHTRYLRKALNVNPMVASAQVRAFYLWIYINGLRKQLKIMACTNTVGCIVIFKELEFYTLVKIEIVSLLRCDTV
jgi:hypothetical protein